MHIWKAKEEKAEAIKTDRIGTLKERIIVQLFWVLPCAKYIYGSFDAGLKQRYV